MKKNVMIFIDRDGTLIYDKKYFVGRQKNWKSLIKFLPTVAAGMKLLNKIPNARVHIVTNQTGVAIKDFPLLTKQRASEVVRYIINLLEKKGIKVDGYEFCPYATEDYAKRESQYKYYKKMVGNFKCIKPNPGMIFKSLKKEGWNKKNTKIYVIGDRVSDVEAALNVGGTGIYIPFKEEEGEKKLVKELCQLNKKCAHVSKNFLEAAKFIVRDSKKGG